jgi:histidine triad (HIT) family protein
MSDCIFCQIIHKEKPAHTIYEDQNLIAFLSHRPINPGHVLVVPKTHYENIYQLPDDEVGVLFTKVKWLAGVVRDTFGFKGIRLIQNNGADAGQVVFHLHVHIIPFTQETLFNHGNFVYTDSDLARDAKKIREKTGLGHSL